LLSYFVYHVFLKIDGGIIYHFVNFFVFSEKNPEVFLNLFSFVYFTKLRLRDSILEVPIGQLAVSNCSLRISPVIAGHYCKV
jgi:hypothetical protein